MTSGDAGHRRRWWAALSAVLGLALLLVWWLASPPEQRASGAHGLDENPRLPVDVLQAAARAAPAQHMPLDVPTPSDEPATAAAVVIHGIVRDPDGQPVVGASVSLQPGRARELPPLESVVTDGEGRFRLQLSSLEQDVFLVVGAEEHIRKSMGPGRNWPSTEIEVVLEWATALSGRVVDVDTGNPLSGAHVSCWGDVAVTDLDGRYRLGRVGVGFDLQVTARLDGYVDASIPTMIREPRESELEIPMQRGSPLVLEVVDRETLQPLPGAEIRRWEDSEVIGTTDAAGRFTFTIGVGFELHAHVSADGYVPVRWSATFRSPLLSSARLLFVRPAWIQGRITDEDGQPVEGADLYASSDEDEVSPDFGLPGIVREALDQSASSGEDGLYRIAVRPSPAAVGLTARPRHHVRRNLGPFVLDTPGMVKHIDFTVARGAIIRGTVRHNGAPWAWGGVTWKDASGRWGGRGSTGEDGSYELLNIEPGEVELRVEEFLAPDAVAPVTLSVEAGQTYVHDIDWSEERTTITGRVTFLTGEPAVGVSVGAWSNGLGMPSGDSTSVDEQGEYVLEVAPGLAYGVYAGKGAQRARRQNVVAGQSGIDFVLPIVGMLRLQLVDALNGEPLRSMDSWRSSMAWRVSGEVAYHRVRESLDIDGVLEIVVPVGAVDVAIAAQDSGYAVRFLEGLVVTGAEEPEPVVVELVPGLELRLPMTGAPDREQLSGHLVFLVAEDERDRIRGPYAEQGGPSNIRINGINLWLGSPHLMGQLVSFRETDTAVVTGLTVGRYEVVCFPDDLVFEPRWIDVRERVTVQAVSWSVP